MDNIIIVIGCSDLNTLYKRMNKAIDEFKSSTYEYFSDIYNTNIILKYLILSGGLSNKKSFIKSEIMEEYALSLGIDKKFIIKDTKSNTTYELFKNIKYILGLSDISRIFQNKNITICTSSYHLRRCILLSNFLLKDYKINYIQTDEEITKDREELENSYIIQILNILTTELLN